MRAAGKRLVFGFFWVFLIDTTVNNTCDVSVFLLFFNNDT